MRAPWWETETYDRDIPVPAELSAAAGPEGPALVRVWKDGRTDAGWGLEGKVPGSGFMANYTAHRFDPKRILPGFESGIHAFAFVMRSMRLVCIDIDGKNGGLAGVKQFGPLPYTLAETSKSGNGYHLFYSIDDEWDEAEGFGRFRDRIGIQQGVDLRVTGCVYHHRNQRWNSRAIVPLPTRIVDGLIEREQKAASVVADIGKTLASGDDMEVLMMHDQLTDDLAAPIPAGRRNNTLFAIGSQMFLAKVPQWDSKVYQRAIDLGLDDAEAVKLVSNIRKYAA